MPSSRTDLAPFETLIRAAFAAEQNGTIDDLLDQHNQPARSDQERVGLSVALLESHDFYLQNVERADWGSVRLLRLEQNAGYAVRVRTDGDDGWLEAFNAEGEPLAAGRTFLDRVIWLAPERVRAMVETREIPAELSEN